MAASILVYEWEVHIGLVYDETSLSIHFAHLNMNIEYVLCISQLSDFFFC